MEVDSLCSWELKRELSATCRTNVELMDSPTCISIVLFYFLFNYLLNFPFNFPFNYYYFLIL